MRNIIDLYEALERYVEIQDLKSVGLVEEEILGYFELYVEEWFKDLNVVEEN